MKVQLNKSMMGKVVKKSWNSKVKNEVPEDVREGHFAVVAVKGEERKRFIVKLEYLRNPEFLRLLELAKEEYGFEQKGALAVPCTPQRLHNIIQKQSPTPPHPS